MRGLATVRAVDLNLRRPLEFDPEAAG